MIEEYIDQVFRSIVTQNTRGGLESIPHSDNFNKEMISSLGIESDYLETIMNILKDSHKILTIAISKEDSNRDVVVEKIDGYVEADLLTVKKLKDYFQRVLVDKYEEENNRRMGVHQVIREIFPRMNIMNNTPIGYIANKAIMLEEYENLMEKDFREYTEEWKANKLKELIAEYGETAPTKIDPKISEKQEQIEEESPKSYQRAIDSETYNEFSSVESKNSLNKVLRIYGVEFFFRVNLRKHNFDFIKEVIENRQITGKADLKMLKNMIQKIKENSKRDPLLKKYSDQLSKLESTVSRFILSGNR